MMTARTWRRPSRLALLVSLCMSAVLVGGCGFQLRGATGTTALPQEWYSMYLATADPNGELSRDLHALFAANGVQWAERPADANYVLQLGPERFSRRNLSINADARAAEFELTLRVRFAVSRRGEGTVIEDSDASVVRQMENDPQNVVGKAEEIRILQGEMRTDLSRQIMRRIGFYAASTSP